MSEKNISVSDFLDEAGIENFPEEFEWDRINDKLNELYEGPPVQDLEPTEQS